MTLLENYVALKYTRMGSSLSALNPSATNKVLGHFPNTWRRIREKDTRLVAAIRQSILSGKLVEHGESVPAGHVHWVNFDGKNYAVKVPETAGWWVNNSSQKLMEIAAANKVAPARVVEIAHNIVPLHVYYPGKEVAIYCEYERLNEAERAAAANVIQAIRSGYSGAGMPGECDRFDVHGDAYAGACDSCGGKKMGADESLDVASVRDYANSNRALAKSQIIEKLVSTAEQLLGMSAGSGAPEARIKAVLAKMPSADKLNVNDASQRAICAKIGRAINEVYGNVVIDTSADAAVVCQQVSEILSSLSAGMHTEFLEVYNDVHRALRNLSVLKDAVNAVHTSLKDKIDEAKNADLSNKVVLLNDLHDKVLNEIERQIQMLSNLLNVHLYPTEKELAGIIRSGKQLPGYIEKIDYKSGTKGFGKVISDVLNGLGMTANFALLIDRSLKTVGMSAEEYAKEPSLDKLRERITNGMMGREFDDKELHEYLKAAELLYQNFFRADEVQTALKKGQGEEPVVGACDWSKTGAADEYEESALDKRVKNKKKLRELIFNAFYRQLNNIYDQLVVSVVNVSNKIGTEIPISDQLNSFRHALIRLQNVIGYKNGRGRNKNIYYALTGYYNDALSRSKREGILGDFDVVAGTVEALMEMPMYASSRAHWESILLHIRAIHSLVEKFSSEIESKFGRGERPAVKGAYDEEDDVVGGSCCGAYEGAADDEDEEYEGGAEDLIKGIHDAPLRRGTTKTIDDAMTEFDYKFRVAQIKENLSKIGPELKNYAEEYEKLNANSVAEVLKREQKIYQAIRKKLDAQVTDATVVTTYDEELKDVDTVKKQKDAAIEFIDWQWDVKKRFWATVEAVDQYMRLFTDGLVNHLDDVREIKSMLDEIEIINDWYDQKTGNMLAGVFDFFPNDLGGANIVYPPDVLRTATTTDTHYYKSVLPATAGNGQAGNPFLVTAPSMGNDARKQCRRALGSLGVLKNLISVFIHIGSRFGGEEIRKKAFMSPSQMYNNLVDYINASAFTQGWNYSVNEDGSFSNFDGDTFDDVIVSYDPKDDRIKSATTGTRLGYANNVEIWPKGGVVEKYLKAVNSARAAYAATVTPDSTSATPRIASLHDWMKALFMMNGDPTTTGIIGITRHYGTATAVGAAALTAAQVDAVTLDNLKTDWNTLDAADRTVGAQVLKRISGTDITWKMVIDEFLDNPLIKTARNPIRVLGRQLTEFLRIVVAANGGATAVPMNGSHDGKALFRKHWGIWMRPTAGYGNAGFTLSQFEGPFKFAQEDKFFVLVMKSLAAKILTTVGLYDVLERPYEYNGLNPLRMILGGDDSVPKIDAEIVPLYVRLPLLAQFYRRIFGFEDPEDPRNKWEKYDEWPGRKETDKAVKISLVPDVEGEFAGLIRLIFRKNRYISVSNYAQPDIYDVIREVNLIHQRMKAKFPQNTIMETIHAFVAEINRRYGVVSKNEREHFFDDDNRRYDYTEETTKGYDGNLPDMGEYAILPGEENDEAVRPSPAQRILGSSLVLPDAKEYKSRYGILDSHAELVRKFRCAIDNHFKNPSYGDTFTQSLRLAQKKVSVAQSDEEKAKIIVNLMRGDDIYTKVDGAKYLVLHETVIAGLNTLSGIYTMLGSVKVLACAIEFLCDEKKMSAAIAKGLHPTHAAGAATQAAIQAYVKHYIETTHKIKDKDIVDAIVDPFVKGDHIRPAAAGLSDSLDVQRIMKAILDTVLGLSTDFQGLVTCRVNSGDQPRLNIAWGGLRGLIETMFQSVSGFITLLKPYIKDVIIDNLLNKIKPGSLYWLQEQLMDKLIIGRPAKGATDTTGWYASLDECFEMINQVYQKTHSFAHGSTLSAMIYYDLSKNGAHHVDDGYANFGALKIIDYKTNPLEGLHLSGPIGKQTLDVRFAARWHGLYDWNNKNWDMNNQSALMGFNQLVAKYLQAFHDPVTNKSYAGAILPVASGVLSGAVASHLNAYPDTAPLKFVRSGKNRSIERDPIDILRSRFTAAQTSKLEAVRKIMKTLSDDIVENDPDVMHVNAFAWKCWKNLMNKVAAVAGGAAAVGQLYDRMITLVPAATAAGGGTDADKLTALIDVTNADWVFGILTAVADIAPAAGGTAADMVAAGITAAMIFVFPAGSGVSDSRDFTRHFLDIKTTAAQVAGGAKYLDNFDYVVLHFPYKNIALAPHQLDLFVHMLLATQTVMQTAPGGGPGGGVAGSYRVIPGTTILQDVTTKVAKMYVDPEKGPAIVVVNYEDLYDVDITGFNDAAKTFAIDPKSLLLLASSDSHSALLGANNIATVPGASSTPPPAGATNSLAENKEYLKRADPTKDTILYSSLAAVFRSMVSSISPSQQHVYLFDNIADVPLHMKEKIRANAPFFKLLFKKLADRCELLRQIIARGQLKCERSAVVGAGRGGGALAQRNPWPYVLRPAEDGHDSNSALFQSILEEIARYCGGFVAVCDQLSREVGDEPKFFEIAQNSIKDYRARHGVNPLMPLSSIMVAFSKYYVVSPGDNWSLPVFGPGDDQFKILYGLRALIANPTSAPTMDAAVGFADMIELYNMSSDSAGQIKKQSAEQFLDTMVKLMRFVFEFRHVSARVQRRLYGGHDLISSFDVLIPAAEDPKDHKNLTLRSIRSSAAAIDAAIAPVGRAPPAGDVIAGMRNYKETLYATIGIHQSYKDIVQFVESSERDSQIQKIVKQIISSAATSKNQRENLDIQNIIDLNIVPINVHALQRHIPLANLYNYGYSFDRMAVEHFLGSVGKPFNVDTGSGHLDSSDTIELIEKLCNSTTLLADYPSTPKLMMLRLLLDPHLTFDSFVKRPTSEKPNIDVEHTYNMLLGLSEDESISRPKFLSDQVFGKMIFGELLHNPTGGVSYGGPVHKARGAVATELTAMTGDGKYEAITEATRGDASKLRAIGRLRFDTKLVRNLIFIVNLFRMVRARLSADLTYTKDVITRAEPITRLALTEFYGHQSKPGPDRSNRSRMGDRYTY